MHPVLLKVGDFELESYFVLVAAGLIIGILYALKRAKPLLREGDAFFDLLLVLVLSVYVGARVFHIVFELPSFYLSNPLEMSKIWKGGFVIHGAFIFVIPAGFFFAKWKKFPALATADILAPPFLLGLSIGRIGCFLTGCCYGKPTGSPIGIIFPPGGAAPTGTPLHPTQLYMSFSALLICLLIISFESRFKKIYFSGLSFVLSLILYPLSRFFIEGYRNDFRGDLICTFTIGQITSMTLMAFGTILFIFLLHKNFFRDRPLH